MFDWKVRRWSGLWLGGGTGEDTEVSVNLEEGVWYWFVLEFLAWDCCTRVCDWLSHIKLPRVIRNWERKWGDDPDRAPCKYEDWWGSGLDTLWHSWVEQPFCQWVWKHKTQAAVWRMPLSEARKQFSSFPQEISWVDKEIAERMGYDKKEAEEKS